MPLVILIRVGHVTVLLYSKKASFINYAVNLDNGGHIEFCTLTFYYYPLCHGD